MVILIFAVCIFTYVSIFSLMRINKDECNPELEESIVNRQLSEKEGFS